MAPLLLDLFCGLGGASRGYVEAGFEVVGVDINPQPDYPYEFIRMDALTYLTVLPWAAGSALPSGPYDAIHVSPPCQHGAAITRGTNAHLRDSYPNLYAPTKDLLQRLGLPYVIENPDARPDVVLCGAAMGLSVLRHRKFELGGWSTFQPTHPKHAGKVRGWRHGVYEDGVWPDGRVMVAVYGKGGGKATLAEAKAAMGIDWSDDYDQIKEAIPPVFTEFIGTGLRALVDYETTKD